MSNPKKANYRPSALADRTPSAPQHTAELAPQEQQARPVEPTAPEASAGPAPRAGDAGKKKHRRNFYSTVVDHQRTEAARKHTMGFTDYSSYTAFVEDAVNRRTRELEAQYNDGRPWA